MEDLAISDLIDLVLSDVADPEDRIQKMFGWYFDREKAIIVWWLGAASSMALAVLTLCFAEKSQLTPGWAILISTFTAEAFMYGVFRLVRLRNIYREFVAALKLFSQLQQIAPFLEIYRSIL
jgi:hypothetical protein